LIDTVSINLALTLGRRARTDRAWGHRNKKYFRALRKMRLTHLLKMRKMHLTATNRRQEPSGKR
jgi:hypothetical protein